MAPDVSVIVLNYNGRRFLPACLGALAGQVGAPPFETILVDNASTDGSVAFVRHEFPAVVVHESGGNLGFAAGNNAGARVARAKVLVFLNNDTVPAADWLARLHAALAERPAFALATSRVVFLDDPDTVDSAGDGYLRAGGAFKHGHRTPAAGHLTSREVFGACGAGFAVRRTVFESVGGFDESLFIYYEDVDLSYRARLQGHRVWYAADAVVRHVGSGTMGVASAATVHYSQRNLEWTWIKNTPRGLLWRTALPHLVYSLAGVAYYATRGRLCAALGGKAAAIAGLPAVLRARRAVQRAAVVDARAIAALMEPHWLGLKRREKAPRAGPGVRPS